MMEPAFATAASNPSYRFQDGLGERHVFFDLPGGEALEALRLRPLLFRAPSFEFALRERVSRLANFRHAAYARVRRVDRTTEPPGLFVVSEHVKGTRLSELLAATEQQGSDFDINAALYLIRQLVPAVALLHQNARDVAHGAIAPERLVVTPHGHLVVAEYVLGAAVEQLNLPRERLWRELRIAVPPSPGQSRLDRRADVMQIGVVALSLILGRPLRQDEFPNRLAELLGSASEMSALGGRQPLSQPLRTWLARTLQLDLRRSFESAIDAQAALDSLLSAAAGYAPAPVALESFLRRHDVNRQQLSLDEHFELMNRAEPTRRIPEVQIARPVEQPSLQTSQQKPDPPITENDPGAGHLLLPSDETLRQAPAPDDAVGESSPVAASPLAEELREESPEIETRAEAVESPAALLSAEAAGGREPQELDDLPPLRRSRRRMIAAAAVIVLASAGAALFMFSDILPFARSSAAVPAVAEGTVSVESTPPGLAVVIAGRDRGVTPLVLSLPPGSYTMEVRTGGAPKIIPFSIAAGGSVAHHIELADIAVSGQLEVVTEPAGAVVMLNGERQGVSPLTITGLAPGSHKVVLETSLGSVGRSVVVQAGTTASLVVPLTALQGAAGGWLSVSSPVEMTVFESGHLVGTTASDRIMLPAGRRDIAVVNDALGFSETRTVQILPGKVTPLKISLPSGVVHLNAVPWAEVWIDGTRVGETPVGNLQIPIGPHEIVFRHPQLGERRHAVTVTASAPTRLSVDLRK
jgi:serine/threonine protein kinase